MAKARQLKSALKTYDGSGLVINYQHFSQPGWQKRFLQKSNLLSQSVSPDNKPGGISPTSNFGMSKFFDNISNNFG